MLLLSGMQSANAMNIDAFMDKHIAPISDFIAKIIFFPIKICGNDVPIIIFWILFAGIFFTIYFIIRQKNCIVLSFILFKLLL